MCEWIYRDGQVCVYVKADGMCSWYVFTEVDLSGWSSLHASTYVDVWRGEYESGYMGEDVRCKSMAADVDVWSVDGMFLRGRARIH